MSLCLAQDPAADSLLSNDPFALLAGMLLDQQFPMERAFAGPYLLAERLGNPRRLDPSLVAEVPDEELEPAAAGPPAIHRYPFAMARRIRTLARTLRDQYGGDAAAIWTTADDAADCLRRLKQLPGFGDTKSRIFLALLGKQLAVELDGWREVSAPYGDPGSHRSVADVVDRESLDQIRVFKKGEKAAARG